jgi:hypothetical protein
MSKIKSFSNANAAFKRHAGFRRISADGRLALPPDIKSVGTELNSAALSDASWNRKAIPDAKQKTQP